MYLMVMKRTVYNQTQIKIFFPHLVWWLGEWGAGNCWKFSYSSGYSASPDLGAEVMVRQAVALTDPMSLLPCLPPLQPQAPHPLPSFPFAPPSHSLCHHLPLTLAPLLTGSVPAVPQAGEHVFAPTPGWPHSGSSSGRVLSWGPSCHTTATAA